MRLQEHDNSLKTNAKNVQSQNFGIGNASVVIDILRNRLYEHKVRTLVQEYICNARDAMREAGQKEHAFDITIPNALNPVFKVRDYGPGITPDRMRDVFVMYGASTKRDDNHQTGGFGIGAKSAWAYTDSFTIVTFIDGVKRTYVAHTGVNNNGRLDHIDTAKTNEKNGTEIQIAVKDQDLSEFRNAVIRCTYFWPELPNLKGELDIKPREKGHVINESIEIWSNYDRHNFGGYGVQAIAIIDGVPYPMSSKLIEVADELYEAVKLCNQTPLFFFKTGELEVSASRESIAMSDYTAKALEKFGKEVLKAITEHVKAQFKKVKTTEQYLNTYTNLIDWLEIRDYAKFKNYEIGYGGQINSSNFTSVKMTQIHDRTKRGTRSTTKIYKDPRAALNIDNYGKIYYLVKDESKVMQNRRIREFLKENKNLILLEPIKGELKTFKKVVKDFKAVNFQTLDAPEPQKIVKPKKVIQRAKEEFCIHRFDSGWNQAKFTDHITLDSNEQKWLFTPIEKGTFSELTLEEVKELDEWLKQNNSEYRICGVAKRSMGIIKGDKNFLPLKEWLANFKPKKEHLNRFKSAKAKNHVAMNTIRQITAKDLKDKFLAEMIREYDNLCHKKSLPSFLEERIRNSSEVEAFVKQDEKLTKLIKEKYSLVYSINYKVNKAELTEYLNYKYKKRG